MTETALTRAIPGFSGLKARVNYWRRIFPAYFGAGASQLTFWHDDPRINERAFDGAIGEYYQDFSQKADYPGPYDSDGIPLLDYRGTIGRQYNPIAIAQYGLGNYHVYRQTSQIERRHKFLKAADWLVEHLEINEHGVPVWQHHFDWEYRESLRSPWYSALAQGQGISLLVRAFIETEERLYLDTARRAFESFELETEQGGVIWRDSAGNCWFEEYVVNPPSHILNGFFWAAWGVYDYALVTGDQTALGLFQDAVKTLTNNLFRYDTGYWSCYELSPTRLPMLASPFYHRLHVVQLQVMHRLTKEPVFLAFARSWEGYERNLMKRTRALSQKVLFKLLYY